MVGSGNKGCETLGPEPARPVNHVPTMKVGQTWMTEAVLADLKANIHTLPEVGSDNLEMIYQAAFRTIAAGGALNIIYSALMDIDAMTEERARTISRSLYFKAESIIRAEQQSNLGIKYAIWLYSGAPCTVNLQQPDGCEQDAAHKAANGKPYLISKGMFLNGDLTWPGRKDGCKCVSNSIIPALIGCYSDKLKDLAE